MAPNNPQSAIRNPRSFDPIDQLAASLNAFEIALAEINAVVPRLDFMRQRIAAELEAVRERRDQLELFDEAEAAAVFRIEPDHLGDLRRGLKLPHVKFGTKVRYTREHLREIAAVFEIRRSSPAKNAKIRRAA